MRLAFRLSTLCLFIALTCLVISAVIPAGGGATAARAAVALADAIMFVFSIVGGIAALILYLKSRRYQHAVEFLLFLLPLAYLVANA